MDIEILCCFCDQFSYVSGIFRRLFRSVEIKNVSFVIFLFMLQNFKVINNNSSATKYNCQVRIRWMITNKQSTNNSLMKEIIRDITSGIKLFFNFLEKYFYDQGQNDQLHQLKDVQSDLSQFAFTKPPIKE